MFAERTWAEKDGAQPLPTLLLRAEKTAANIYLAFEPASVHGLKKFAD
jgi:hypothetical protein